VHSRFFAFCFRLCLFTCATDADAAILHLSWVDNSKNEDGFNIERKLATDTEYARLATVGTNVISYADMTPIDGKMYCYRVNAFNRAGTSPYSDAVCGTAHEGQPGDLNVPTESGDTTSATSILTVQVVRETNAGGTSNGRVISHPKGINCSNTCVATFRNGHKVRLRAIPAVKSIFVGWSGDGECTEGSVTMTRDISCSATFRPLTYALSVSLGGNGTGRVTSDLAGIDCGPKCVSVFAKNARVKLSATPAPDSFFSGWSGGRDCRNGTVTMKGEKSCTAVFIKRMPSNVGIFRPSSGAWYLTTTLGGLWHGCDVDYCREGFGMAGNHPIAGDWDGSGKSKVGIFDPQENIWEFGMVAPKILNFAVPKTSGIPQIPITGSWGKSGKDFVGIYQLMPDQSGHWYLDGNGNGTWDGCTKDRCLGPFGRVGEVPVVGDWNGNSVSNIGVFDPESGTWTIDYNGNGKFDGCSIDKCLGPFGFVYDIPVVGDWDDSGNSKIGVFRPNSGEWFLDLNGNGQWDGCSVDKCISGFGQAGDLPVVGKW
jgi:List-Bact-rpt repeat protein